ncbi:MAG: signal peptide peptidase SppA [Myxococcota bacterium]
MTLWFAALVAAWQHAAMRPRTLASSALGFGAAALVAAPLMAQVAAPRASDGVTLPWRALAATDDSSAIAVNPANLVRLPSPEVRATAVYTPDAAQLPYRGYSFGLGLPIWVLATGLQLDVMDPTGASPPPFALAGDAQRYTWLRWSQSLALGEALSLGNTFAWSFSETPALHQFFTVATGMTVRAHRFVSAAVVARDWNRPTNDAGAELRPSVDFGATVRPLDGDKFLELGLEGSYRSADDTWVPTANAAVDLPYVGRLRLGGTLLDPSEGQFTASAALDVNLDRFQVTAGSVFGNAQGFDGTGLVASAAIRPFRETPGIPLASHVVKIRFEGTPDARRHVGWLRALWKLADDPEVAGVLFEMRASPAGSLAQAEELVDAIELLKRRGKKVMCHLEDAGGRELFVCSAADRIAINPAGGIRFAGLSGRYFYLGGLMRKLGIRADFVRIGRHKLAAEQFTEGPSDIGRADHRELLAEYEAMYLQQVGRGRNMRLEVAKKVIARGPFVATEALDGQLVDQLVYEDEIPRFVRETMGRPLRVRDIEERPERAPRRWRNGKRVAVIYLEGTMVDGKSRTIPLLNIQLAGSYTLRKALERARTDDSIGAVVFRMETGGGSSLASDVILREATLLAKKKPLIVSMGRAAASGGYYAAVAGEEIFALPSTVTGSIGIFYGKADIAQLLDAIGVRTEATRSAPRADAESIFRPFTDEERTELGRKVKQFYDLFVGRVAEGRNLSPAAVDAIARGKVWTGRQAQARKLVDQLGGMRQALARARLRGDVDPDAPILELPPRERSLLGTVLALVGVPGLRAEAQPLGWVPPPLLEVARALMPFTVFRPYQPLALMDVLYTWE